MNPFVTSYLFGIAVLSGVLTLWPLRETGWAQNFAEGTIQQVKRDWHEIPPREQSRILKDYRHFKKQPPERQRYYQQEKYHRWLELPAEEQNRLHENYRRYRGMNSDEKEEFDRKSRRWRSHPRD